VSTPDGSNVRPLLVEPFIRLPSPSLNSPLVFAMSNLLNHDLREPYLDHTYKRLHHQVNRLMVLETPLLRVSRPVAACSRCRAAKVKCDGKLPACTACERSNRASECSSTNDQFARGKERSYVATLEARVERLEKKITEQRARRKSSTLMMDVSEAPTPRRASVDTVKAPKTISKRAARRREASEIDDLVSDFGLL
jgi:hypothetical protein